MSRVIIRQEKYETLKSQLAAVTAENKALRENDAASNLEWLASHPKTEIFNDGIYVWLKIQTEEPTWIYTGKCTSIHKAVEVAKMSKQVTKDEKYTKKN